MISIMCLYRGTHIRYARCDLVLLLLFPGSAPVTCHYPHHIRFYYPRFQCCLMGQIIQTCPVMRPCRTAFFCSYLLFVSSSSKKSYVSMYSNTHGPLCKWMHRGRITTLCSMFQAHVKEDGH